MATNPSMKPLLIKFDVGLLKRIELEVAAASLEANATAVSTGHPRRELARTEVIRDLITESLAARCQRRNEVVPEIVPYVDEEPEEDFGEFTGGDAKAYPLSVAAPAQITQSEPAPVRKISLPVLGAMIAAIAGPDTIRIVHGYAFPDYGPALSSAPAGDPDSGDVAKVTVRRVLEVDTEAHEFVPEVFGSMDSMQGLPARAGAFAQDVGTTVGVEAEGASVEFAARGDACEVRSGGNHESTAAGRSLQGLPAQAGAFAGCEVEAVEVGEAGGRGWLGDSVKTIGV
jgi:hypothetical protein